MGSKIWTGLAMASVMTLLVSGLFTLIGFSFQSASMTLVAFAVSIFVWFCIGYRYHKVFEPIMDFIHQLMP